MNKNLYILSVLTGIIIFFLTACTSLAPVRPQSESRIPIVAIVNNTGFECYELYAKSASDQNWGNDLLGTETLPNGETFRVKLKISLGIADIYDIRMVDVDNDTYTKYRLRLENGSNIVFTKRDSDDY